MLPVGLSADDISKAGLHAANTDYTFAHKAGESYKKHIELPISFL